VRRHTFKFATASLAALLGILSVPHPACAQAPNPAQMTPAQLHQPDIPVPPYNPYPPLPGSTPPTVLPPDLQRPATFHLNELTRRRVPRCAYLMDNNVRI
jgi:hypothetical protein